MRIDSETVEVARHLRGKRRVSDMPSKGRHLWSCFSSRAEERFDQTFSKFDEDDVRATAVVKDFMQRVSDGD